MKNADIQIFRDLLLRHAGLGLSAEDAEALDPRLMPVARKWGYPSAQALALALRGHPDSALVNDIVESLLNAETSFFRDKDVFTALRDVLVPHVMQHRAAGKTVRIWSAGCGSGQETCAIALTLKTIEPKLKGWKIDILGTDLSASALRKARAGDYTPAEVQRGLPVADLLRYFTERDDVWHLHDDILRLMRFEQHNLTDPVEGPGLFDIIFCRNVLCDFEPRARRDVLGRLTGQLAENGFLVMGRTESAGDTGLQALPECPGLYGHADGVSNTAARSVFHI